MIIESQISKQQFILDWLQSYISLHFINIIWRIIL